MTGRLVLDASAVVTMLVDPGSAGEQVADLMRATDAHAPAVLPFEVAQVLRRHELAGRLAPADAMACFQRSRLLPVELVPFDELAERVWELRHSVSAYDAAYVALAEALGAPLVTLDRRLTRAAGIRCEVLVP